MPSFWAYHDVDIPYTEAPLSLTTPGLAEVWFAIGTWAADYRDGVSVSIRNDSAAATTLRVALRSAAWAWMNESSISIAPSTTEVFSVTAAGQSVDIYAITIDGNAVDCVLTLLELGSAVVPIYAEGVMETITPTMSGGSGPRVYAGAYGLPQVVIEGRVFKGFNLPVPFIEGGATIPPTGYGQYRFRNIVIDGLSLRPGSYDLPATTINGVAGVPVVAAGAFTLPKVDIHGAVLFPPVADGGYQIPALAINGTILVPPLANGAYSLPKTAITGIGVAGITASGSYALPLVAIDGTGTAQIPAATLNAGGNYAAPPMSISGYGSIPYIAVGNGFMLPVPQIKGKVQRAPGGTILQFYVEPRPSSTLTTPPAVGVLQFDRG